MEGRGSMRRRWRLAPSFPDTAAVTRINIASPLLRVTAYRRGLFRGPVPLLRSVDGREMLHSWCGTCTGRNGNKGNRKVVPVRPFLRVGRPGNWYSIPGGITNFSLPILGSIQRPIQWIAPWVKCSRGEAGQWHSYRAKGYKAPSFPLPHSVVVN